MGDVKCPTCNDTRMIPTSPDHGRLCDKCCEHPAERRYRQFEGQPHPGVETCGLCGREFTPPEQKER